MSNPLTRHQSKVLSRKPTILVSGLPHLAPPPKNSIEELEEIVRYQEMSRKDPARLILVEVFDSSFIDDFIRMLPSGSGPSVRPLLQILSNDCNTLTLREKLYHNRIRPIEFAKEINFNLLAHDTNSSKNPSYPSGHAALSRILALALTELYPHKEDILMELSDSVGRSRLDAGVHYPSDIKAGIEWAEHCWSLSRNAKLISKPAIINE